MSGYHLKDIKKGVLGELSKIQEELDEIQDAEEQNCKIMVGCELSDLYGALEAYAAKYGLTMEDLKIMSECTKRAFECGRRVSEELVKKKEINIVPPGVSYVTPPKRIKKYVPDLEDCDDVFYKLDGVDGFILKHKAPKYGKIHLSGTYFVNLSDSKITAGSIWPIDKSDQNIQLEPASSIRIKHVSLYGFDLVKDNEYYIYTDFSNIDWSKYTIKPMLDEELDLITDKFIILAGGTKDAPTM